MQTSPKLVFRDGVAMVAASVAFVTVSWNGVIGTSEACALLAGLLLFLAVSFALDWRRPSPFGVRSARRQPRGTIGRRSARGSSVLALGALFTLFRQPIPDRRRHGHCA